MDLTNYSHIRNTLLNISELFVPVFSILLSGRDVGVAVDTTSGNITVELLPYQWQMGAVSYLVVDNIAGSNDIDLVSTTILDTRLKAWTLQRALNLTAKNASVILKLIRAGSGNSAIYMNGTQVMDSNSITSYVLIQATDVDFFQETNLIAPVLGGGSAQFVTLGTNQTITGIKTFAGAPVISTITNTGTLTLPTTTDTLVGRITTDTLQNKSLVANNCSFIDGTDNSKRLTFSTSSNGIGAITNIISVSSANRNITLPDNSGTLALISDLPPTGNFVTIDGNQTILGTKIFAGTFKISDTIVQAGTPLPTIIQLPSTSGTLTLESALLNYVNLITNQTIGGIKTFTGTINSTGNSIFSNSVPITSVTNQLVLGTTNTTTINSIAPSASRIYTIRDAGTDSDFILSTSTTGQTISGGLTSSGLTALGGSFQRLIYTISTNTVLSTSLNGHYIVVTGNSITITLPAIASSSALSGYEYYIFNIGTGFVTVNVNNSLTESMNNNGSLTSTLYMNQNDRIHVISYSSGASGLWTVESNLTPNLNPLDSVITARDSNRNWSSIASSADGVKLVAAVDNGRLYRSIDSGATWIEITTPPVNVNLSWTSVASSADGVKLVALVIAGRIYTSTNSGETWVEITTVPVNVNRNWFAVASSADGTKLVALDLGGQIYTSVNSGLNWTARESNRGWRAVASSADGSKLVAVIPSDRIYTSTDSGVTWIPRESPRQWVSVASSADGLKLVATVSGGQIYTSTDSGVNWTARESNRDWYTVASSADGTKLVAVVPGGQIYTSTDSGVNWTARESNRDWYTVASSADGTKLVAAVSGGQIYTINLFDSSIATLSRSLYNINGGTNNANLNVAHIPISTLTATNTMAVTNASSLYIEGSPITSSNITGTNSYALNVNSGNSIFGGNISVTGATMLKGPLQRSVYSISANTILSTTQNGHYVVVTANSITITLPSIATNSLLAGYEYYIFNVGTGFVTVNVNNTLFESFNASGMIYDTLYLNQNDRIHIISYSNGTTGIWNVESNLTANLNPTDLLTARDSIRIWWAVASSADGTKLVAAVSGGRIYTSADGGVTWTARDTNRFWFSVASSADGTKLVAVASADQIYTSTDSGETWTAQESNRDWTSVASSADGTRLVATVDVGRIYISTDSGDNWTQINTAPVDVNRAWTSVASSADGTRLVAAVNGGQIYTSTNSGANWTARESNRVWISVASSADGTKLVAAVNGGRIYISTDSGVTWIARESNRDWFKIAISSDGSKLVAIVNPGQIYTSSTFLYNNGNISTISEPLYTINGNNTTNLNAVGIPISTVSANNAMTTTNASSLYIEGAPSLSPNITRTNAYALNVASGNSVFGGNVTVTNQLNLNRAGGGFSNTNATFSKTINTGTSSTPIFTVTCLGLFGAMFVEMIAVGTSFNIQGLGVVCNSVISVTANNAPQIYQTLNTPVSGNLAVTTYWGNASSGFNFQGTVSGSTVTYSIQTSGGGGTYDVYVRAYGGGNGATFTINN